jgi:hypothetical protein
LNAYLHGSLHAGESLVAPLDDRCCPHMKLCARVGGHQQVAQTGFERILGTVLGGSLGYAVFSLGEEVWALSKSQRDDGLALTLCASAVAWFGVWAGSRLKLDYSVRRPT